MGRGATCIPAFEIVMPEASESPEEEGQEATEEDGTVFAPDYNFEDLDYTVKPDFIETVRAACSKKDQHHRTHRECGVGPTGANAQRSIFRRTECLIRAWNTSAELLLHGRAQTSGLLRVRAALSSVLW